MDYTNFKKQTYEKMIDFWKHPQRLSYIIRVPELNDILSRDSQLTKQKIVEDFKKYPLVRDAGISLGQIVLFPK